MKKKPTPDVAPPFESSDWMDRIVLYEGESQAEREERYPELRITPEIRAKAAADAKRRDK